MVWPQVNHFTYLDITLIILKNKGWMENSPRQPSLKQKSVNDSCKHPESKNISGFAGQGGHRGDCSTWPCGTIAGTEQASVAVFQ